MLDDEYFMRQALQEAHKAFDIGEVPVGAVIVSNQRIIARAHNLTETLTDVTAHAEMQAITAAANLLGGKYLNDCILYVTLEPCVMCAGALGWSQIGKIVFGAYDEKTGAVGSVTNVLEQKSNHQIAYEGGILRDECSKLLSEFFKTKRNK